MTSVFSFSVQSLSPHVLPCSGPFPKLSIPQAPRSGTASSAALWLSPPPPRSCFSHKGPQPNQAPGEMAGATSQLRHFMDWSWGGGGQGAPITHARTCSKANLYVPLRLSRWRNVRTHCKAANRAAGGSPPGQAERAGAGAQRKPSTCTPCLAAGSGEHTSGLCPRLVSPQLLQVKSSRKKLEQSLWLCWPCPCSRVERVSCLGSQAGRRALLREHLPPGWCPGHLAVGELCLQGQGRRMSVVPPLHEREHSEGRRARLRGAELCRVLLLADGVRHYPSLQERGEGPVKPSWALISQLVHS